MATKFSFGIEGKRGEAALNLLKALPGNANAQLVEITKEVLEGVSVMRNVQSLKVGDEFSNIAFIAYQPNLKRQDGTQGYAINMVTEVDGKDVLVGGLFRTWPADTSVMTSVSENDRLKLQAWITKNKAYEKNALQSDESVEDYCARLAKHGNGEVIDRITITSMANVGGTPRAIRQTYYAFNF